MSAAAPAKVMALFYAILFRFDIYFVLKRSLLWSSLRAFPIRVLETEICSDGTEKTITFKLCSIRVRQTAMSAA